MNLWIAWNGWMGEGGVCVVVDAPTEEAAREKADAAFRAEAETHTHETRKQRESYATTDSIEPFHTGVVFTSDYDDEAA